MANHQKTSPGYQTRSAPAKPLRFLLLAARLLLGTMLIVMGWNKAMDPVGFLKLLREYQMLASPWPINAVAAWLPWFEIFCGMLLLGNVATRGTALIVASLFLFFSTAILLRALDLHAGGTQPFCSLRFDCGCGAGEVFVCSKLVENVLWFALSCWLVISRYTPAEFFHHRSRGSDEKLAESYPPDR